MKRAENILTVMGSEVKIKSTDLVDIINQFRKFEGNKVELSHSDFMKKVRKELESLTKAGITNQGNISSVEYVDAKGERRPCYELNREGMIQMMNAESAVVRYSTTEYIKKIEKELRGVPPMITADDVLEYNILNARSDQDRIRAIKEFKAFNNNRIALLESEREKDRFLIEFAKERLANGDNFTLSKCTKLFNLKRGQIVGWAKETGYLTENSEVSYVGQGYFVTYGKDYKGVAVTERGLDLVRENLDDIRKIQLKRNTNKKLLTNTQ